MKLRKTQLLCVLVTGCGLMAVILRAVAGSLNIQGGCNVSNNLTATSVSLAGDTRSSWPANVSPDGATDLASPVLDFSQPGQFFRYTLTGNAAWIFTNHVAGRVVWLQITQDSTGNWTNAWPSGLQWASGRVGGVSTNPRRFNVFRIIDNGDTWLVQNEGLEYFKSCNNGCSGCALYFDGSPTNSASSYVDCVNGADANITNNLTLEAWVKLNDYGGSYGSTVVERMCSDSSFAQYSLRFTSGGSLIMFCTTDLSSTQSVMGASSVSTGQWHHVAVTFADGTVKFWIDGNLDNQTTTSGTVLAEYGAPASLGIGVWVPAPDHFDGVIDEVRISSVVRYTNNFNAATSFTLDSDTVAYWKFTESSGWSTSDETGNHNGTFSGARLPQWVEGR